MQRGKGPCATAEISGARHCSEAAVHVCSVEGAMLYGGWGRETVWQKWGEE